MDTFVVPVILAPPGPTDVAGSVDALLTALCRAAPALLHAEWTGDSPGVSWLLRRRAPGPAGDEEVGRTDSPGLFRSLLARLGWGYLAGQLYGGYRVALLEQGGR